MSRFFRYFHEFFPVFVRDFHDACLLLSKTKGRKRSVAFGESSYKKHPGGLEAHEALARTHTQKKQGHAYHCCLLCHRHASIDRFRPVVHRHFLAGSRWFRWTDTIRERPTSRSLFFRSNLMLFDRSKRARGEENAKQILDARAGARKHAKNTHREKKKKKKRNNDDAPVYCSTLDFTHPSNPSSNVSKNAAPSTSRLALDADADDANAATVVAHAIVFFKPQYVLFFCRRRP